MCSRSILAVRLRTDAFGTALGSSKILWRPCVFGKYSGSILGAYGMYGKRWGSMRLVLGAFGMKSWRCWVPYAFRTPQMDLEHDECFPNVFSIVRNACGKSSVHSRSIRRVLKAFGKHAESVRKGNLSKSTLRKYSVYSETILKTFGKQTSLPYSGVRMPCRLHRQPITRLS